MPERADDPWFATGELHSKGSAGRYALETFDARWHPILAEALRIRDGEGGPSAYADLAQRRRDTRDLVAAVVALHAGAG